MIKKTYLLNLSKWQTLLPPPIEKWWKNKRLRLFSSSTTSRILLNARLQNIFHYTTSCPDKQTFSLSLVFFLSFHIQNRILQSESHPLSILLADSLIKSYRFPRVNPPIPSKPSSGFAFPLLKIFSSPKKAPKHSCSGAYNLGVKGFLLFMLPKCDAMSQHFRPKKHLP